MRRVASLNCRRLCFALLMFACSGCALAFLREGAADLGATPGDREKLLQRQLKSYEDAMYWSNLQKLTALADQSAKPLLLQFNKGLGDELRVTSVKAKFTDYSSGHMKALSQVEVKYYRVPRYIMETRNEEVEWRFSVTDGWKIFAVKKL